MHDNINPIFEICKSLIIICKSIFIIVISIILSKLLKIFLGVKEYVKRIENDIDLIEKGWNEAKIVDKGL